MSGSYGSFWKQSNSYDFNLIENIIDSFTHLDDHVEKMLEGT